MIVDTTCGGTANAVTNLNASLANNGYTYLKDQLTTGYADITLVYGTAGDN